MVAVDGVGVEQFDGLIALRALLTEEAGTEYTFAIERDGETVELTLVLRDLFDVSEE